MSTPQQIGKTKRWRREQDENREAQRNLKTGLIEEEGVLMGGGYS